MFTSATVKYSARLIETQYGQRYNAVVVIDETGEEIKLWGNHNSDVSFLQKGENVTLVDIDGKWKMTSNTPITPALTDETTVKGQLTDVEITKAQIKHLGEIFMLCADEAQAIASAGLSNSDINNIAIALFNAQKTK